MALQSGLDQVARWYGKLCTKVSIAGKHFVPTSLQKKISNTVYIGHNYQLKNGQQDETCWTGNYNQLVQL